MAGCVYFDAPTARPTLTIARDGAPSVISTTATAANSWPQPPCGIRGMHEAGAINAVHTAADQAESD